MNKNIMKMKMIRIIIYKLVKKIQNLKLMNKQKKKRNKKSLNITKVSKNNPYFKYNLNNNK